MMRIGLLSDTHGYLDDSVFRHFKNCQEIWHAGDFGNAALAEEISSRSGLPLRGVWGNIDGADVRSRFPQKLSWHCEDVAVYMTHIGGYPNRYSPGIKAELVQQKAKLFISGHSHILKVIYDPAIDCLHMNPGAAGKQGWHQVRTLLRFVIEGSNIKDCEVIELGPRAR